MDNKTLSILESRWEGIRKRYAKINLSSLNTLQTYALTQLDFKDALHFLYALKYTKEELYKEDKQRKLWSRGITEDLKLYDDLYFWMLDRDSGVPKNIYDICMRVPIGQWDSEILATMLYFVYKSAKQFRALDKQREEPRYQNPKEHLKIYHKV